MRILVICVFASGILLLIGVSAAWAEFRSGLDHREVLEGTAPMVTEAATPAPVPSETPRQGVRLTSTAYCLTGKMANGKQVHDGAAASNKFFGKRLRLKSGPLAGKEVTVEDRHAKGSTELDIWMADCELALEYGRKHIEVEMLP